MVLARIYEFPILMQEIYRIAKGHIRGLLYSGQTFVVVNIFYGIIHLYSYFIRWEDGAH